MECGVDQYCIRKMMSLAALLDSVLTSRLVSQSKPAVQWPHLRRGDMEHNRAASLRWLPKLFGDKLGSIIGDHLAQNTIMSKHLSQHCHCSTSCGGIHHTDFRPLRVGVNSYSALKTIVSTIVWKQSQHHIHILII